MVTRTFPLLVLPYLALCNVLDLFNLNELIHFSFCSKRTQRIAARKPKGRVEIILYAKKQPEFIVRLNNQQTYKFVISGMSKSFLNTQVWKPTPIAGVIVPTKTDVSYYGYLSVITATFRIEAAQGIDKVGTYLTKLLKTPITEIQFLSEKKDNDTIGIIDSVKSKQNSVGKCFVAHMKNTDRYLTHLLSNLEITDDFNSVAMPSSLFHYVRSFNCARLSVLHGKWFTAEHLLTMNCQYVHIQETNIISTDLNQFLKHWQNGGCSSLEFLLLTVSFYMLPDIIEGIEVEEIPDTIWRSFLGHNGDTIQMRGGHDIKRNDGTVGTIFSTHRYLFRFAFQL
ncbi:unnamed protein product [Caenorhabditis brenneri]